MTSYLKYDENQDDFEDVDDEDLMLAEMSDVTINLPHKDLKRSFDSEDGSPSKKVRTEKGSSIALAQEILNSNVPKSGTPVLSASEALAPILRFSIGIVSYGEYLPTIRIFL